MRSYCELPSSTSFRMAMALLVASTLPAAALAWCTASVGVAVGGLNEIGILSGRPSVQVVEGQGLRGSARVALVRVGVADGLGVEAVLVHQRRPCLGVE